MINAIEEAKKVTSDIPVGAVIKSGDKIVASCHNLKEELNDVTAHAEILAIKEAEQKLGRWRLDDCDMYVTLEPCPMCAWAILQSRIKNLYFGSYDRQYGGFSVYRLQSKTNSSINIYGGIMEEECDKLLKEFFEKIR